MVFLGRYFKFFLEFAITFLFHCSLFSIPSLPSTLSPSLLPSSLSLSFLPFLPPFVPPSLPCAYVSTCVHGKCVEDNLGSFLRCLHFLFETWSQLGQRILTCKATRLSSYYLHDYRYTTKPVFLCFLTWIFRNQNTILHVCVASTLFTNLFSQFPHVFLK